MRERERIQKEIDEIIAFTSEKAWTDFLQKKGNAHNYYYHYTTLGTLKAILENETWKFKQANCSNDPLEQPIHSTSFTTSVLSSMGMWEMYSGLSSKDDIGVRICIPRATFKEIFSGDVTWYSKDSEGNYREFCKYAPTITDMAYWHFGKDKNSSLAIYRNYQLAGAALHFWFQQEDKLPPCFKSAIWRKEEEVRVFGDFSHQTDIPEDLYLKIKPEQLKNMYFRLSPAIKNYKSFGLLPQMETLKDILYFIVKEILGGKLDIGQFTLPTEYEQW